MADSEHDLAPSLSQSQFLRIALDALSVRAARWLTLLFSFGLFAATLYRPSWLRLATAAAFTMLVHLPLWWKRETRGK